jgi:hypothetical protein
MQVGRQATRMVQDPAFPDLEHGPAERFKLTRLPAIARAVGLELRPPEAPIIAGQSLLALRAVVPEAAVNEDRNEATGKRYVGSA